MQGPTVKTNTGQNPTLQIYDDMIIKEEFEFKSITQPQRPFQQLQKLSMLAILSSICQLTYSGLSFSHSPSSFISILALMALFLSLTLAVWSTRILKIERNRTLLTQDTSDSICERMTAILFPALVLRGTACFIVVPNMILHRNNAYVSNIMPESSSLTFILLTMLLFLELLNCMIFLKAAWTCFKYLKPQGQAITRLVSLSNLILMASSLTLIYHSIRLTSHPLHSLDSSPPFNTHSQWFLILGISAGVMTLFVWLTKSRKWRVPSLLVTVVMTILTLSLGILTVIGYVNASDLTEFSQDMSLFQLTNWGLISCFSSLLVTIGNFYLLRTNYRDTTPRSKKDYGWLGILLAMVLVFIVTLSLQTRAFVFSENQSLNEEAPLVQMDRNEDVDKWFGGSGIDMDSDLSRKISGMFFSKDNRFVTMRLNDNYDHIMLSRSGDYSQQYEDFISSLSPFRAEIGLVRIPLDNSHDALVGVVWIPPSISPIEKEIYLRYYAVDPAHPRSERLGFPVYVATSAEDLAQEAIMADVSRLRSVLIEDELLEANEQDLIMERQEIMFVLAEEPQTLGFSVIGDLSPQDASEIYKMFLNKKYQYIIISADPVTKKPRIEVKGDWFSTYDNFTEHFRSEDTRAAYIYLDVDGKTRLTLLIYESEELARQMDEIGGLRNFPMITVLDRMGVYVYIARSLEDMKLENVMRGISPKSQTDPQIPGPEIGAVPE